MEEDSDPSAAQMRDLANRAEAGLEALEKERAATVEGGRLPATGPEATQPSQLGQQAPLQG
eukprot:14491241-Alexandrium_andersonii.AAC.1